MEALVAIAIGVLTAAGLYLMLRARTFPVLLGLTLGSVQIEAVHTPGHRPEHTSFLLRDEGRGDQPWALLSGDSLFVGDVARPDLAVEKEEGARGIFRSLHERLLTLPPETVVHTGHGESTTVGDALSHIDEWDPR